MELAACSWVAPGTSWVLLGAPGVILGSSWVLLGSSWVFVGCKDDPQNMNPFEPNGPSPDPFGLNGSYSNKILPRKVPQTFPSFFVPRKDVGRLA